MTTTMRILPSFRRASRLAFFASVVIGSAAHATSIDCDHVRSSVDRMICSEPALIGFDQQVSWAYDIALSELGKADSEVLAGALRRQQRRWLSDARDACLDTACLAGEYEARLILLKNVALLAERPLARMNRGLAGTPTATCPFTPKKPLGDFAVVVAFGGGRELPFQIDQSGHVAIGMDVTVNVPDRPVVVMLSGYDPTVWTIARTASTRILGVVVSGAYRQVVSGLDPSTPIVIQDADHPVADCPMFIGENGFRDFNPAARAMFGRPVDRLYLGKGGVVVVGNALEPGSTTISVDPRPVDTWKNPAAPLAGTAGIEEAVRQGILRPATSADITAWVDSVVKRGVRPDVPPYDGIRLPGLVTPGVANAYVIVKPFVLPAGLYGGQSATFFVSDGVPYPRGDLGHSTIYDLNTAGCSGVGCRF